MSSVNLDWIIKEKKSPDRIAAEKISNGRNWIEVAQETRVAEWEAMLSQMTGYPIWEDGTPDFVEAYGQREPALYEYPEPDDEEDRGAVIICAGGGFMFKSEWEAEPVARRFYEAGFRTYILDYRVSPYSREISAMDAIRAVRYLRYHAEEFHVRPDRICMMGGSAGGMQSMMPATQFDYGDPLAEDPVERVSSRTDAAVIWYGTFMSSAQVGAPGGAFSFEEQNRGTALASELHVRPDSPPFFIWQTTADDPRHLCNFGRVLTDYGIPFEMHLFPDAPHGCGLADGGHPFAGYARGTSRWSQMAIEFLQNLGF